MNQPTGKASSIILADDHELIREAVKPYLAQLYDPAPTVVESGSYGDVIEICKSAKASDTGISLIVLDLKMPGNPPEDQFVGLRRIKQEMPLVPVVVFSSSEDNATVIGALKNGAQGFVPKSTRGRSLVNALKLVLAGEIYVPPSVATAPLDAPSNSPKSIMDELSPRELESLRMPAKGLSNKEIARELGVQSVTVKLHLRNAYRKIGASNRVDAVRIAVENNIA